MSGSPLRRAVFGAFVVALLLPLASAWAVPAGSHGGPQTWSIQSWSREILQSVNDLLHGFRLVTDRATTSTITFPPPGGDNGNGEGNGIDPHGRP